VAESSKGYKFKMEFEFTGADESKTRLVAYGDTAEEVIEGHTPLSEEYRKFVDREAKKPYDNQ